MCVGQSVDSERAAAQCEARRAARQRPSAGRAHLAWRTARYATGSRACVMRSSRLVAAAASGAAASCYRTRSCADAAPLSSGQTGGGRVRGHEGRLAGVGRERDSDMVAAGRGFRHILWAGPNAGGDTTSVPAVAHPFDHAVRPSSVLVALIRCCCSRFKSAQSSSIAFRSDLRVSDPPGLPQGVQGSAAARL